MSEETVRTHEVFKGTIEVMLEDGILNREEKRLIIKLSNQLKLEPEEPALIYRAIQEGTEIEGGREMATAERLRVFERVYEVALLNESLSRDEYRVVAHLRNNLHISDKEFEDIEAHLKKIVKERFEDKMVDKMLSTLKDSVSLVGSLFDKIRTKTV